MINIGSMFKLRNSGGGKKQCPDNGLMLSVHSGGEGRKALCISIGIDLMKSARFTAGERVTLDFDCPKSEVTIRKTTPSEKCVSWALSASGVTADKAKGQTLACVIKFQTTPQMLVAFGMEDATAPYIAPIALAGQHGITFPLRKQWNTVMNARQS